MIVLGGGIVAMFLRRREVVIGARVKLMFAFVVVMAIGTPFATNRYWAFMATKDLALFVGGAVLPLTNFVNTDARMRKLVQVLVAIHIPMIFYCLTHGGHGIGSFLGDENDFCLALNVVLPYAFFSLYLARTTLHRLYLVGTIGLLLFTITATMSRGGFVGLVAVAIACWLAAPRKVLSAAGIGVLALAVLSFVPSSYWDKMKTIETSTDEGDTGAQRIYLWGLAWEMFKDNPILGVGPTNFQWNSYKYKSAAHTDRGEHIWGKGAHSLYYTLLPEEGLVGLAIFVSILAIGLRENRRIRKTYRTLVKQQAPAELLERLRPLTIFSRANDVAILGYLVTGAFLSVLYLSVLLAASRVRHRNRSTVRQVGDERRIPRSRPRCGVAVDSSGPVRGPPRELGSSRVMPWLHGQSSACAAEEHGSTFGYSAEAAVAQAATCTRSIGSA